MADNRIPEPPTLMLDYPNAVHKIQQNRRKLNSLIVPTEVPRTTPASSVPLRRCLAEATSSEMGTFWACYPLNQNICQTEQAMSWIILASNRAASEAKSRGARAQVHRSGFGLSKSGNPLMLDGAVALDEFLKPPVLGFAASCIRVSQALGADFSRYIRGTGLTLQVSCLCDE